MIDPRSPEWREIRKQIDKQIQDAQTSLEAKGMPMNETSELRGEIYGLRQLIRHVEDPFIPEDGQAIDYSRS
jgi:hypothetical protein